MTAPPLPESALRRFIPSNEAMKPLANVEDAYRMGRDYVLSGPNEDNCHFRLFAKPDHTRS
jgi:hypothetical protein